MANQKSLYEGQPVGLETPGTSGRDEFVVTALRRVSEARRRVEVLELSVGDGALTGAMLGVPEVVVHAADISAARLAKIERTMNCPERLRIIECNLDAGFSAFPAAAFDVVIALDILEHVFDVFGFVANCARVIRPRGVLFLRVPNIGFIKRRLELLTGRLPITSSWFGPKEDYDAWRQTWGWDGGHLHYFTLRSIIALLRQEGFHVSHVGDPGSRFSNIRRLWPAMLCGNLLVRAER